MLSFLVTLTGGDGGYCPRTLPLTTNLLLGVDNGALSDNLASYAGAVYGAADLGALRCFLSLYPLLHRSPFLFSVQLRTFSSAL